MQDIVLQTLVCRRSRIRLAREVDEQLEPRTPLNCWVSARLHDQREVVAALVTRRLSCGHAGFHHVRLRLQLVRSIRDDCASDRRRQPRGACRVAVLAALGVHPGNADGVVGRGGGRGPQRDAQQPDAAADGALPAGRRGARARRRRRIRTRRGWRADRQAARHGDRRRHLQRLLGNRRQHAGTVHGERADRGRCGPRLRPRRRHAAAAVRRRRVRRRGQLVRHRSSAPGRAPESDCGSRARPQAGRRVPADDHPRRLEDVAGLAAARASPVAEPGTLARTASAARIQRGGRRHAVYNPVFPRQEARCDTHPRVDDTPSEPHPCRAIESHRPCPRTARDADLDEARWRTDHPRPRSERQVERPSGVLPVASPRA